MGANLRQVAARAGVSIRTVSNVVNDFPLVAADTRRRVQQAIDELQYIPNAAARSLRGGRSGLVGLVIPEIAAPYFGEIAALLTRGAERHGWTMLVEQTDGDADRERRLLDGVRGHLVDGLIVNPWTLAPAELRRRDDGPPLVLLGEHHAGSLFDHVAVDNVAAARELTHHLIGLGRRRIAAIGVQPHLRNETARQRLDGYRQALADAGLPRDERLEIPVRALHRADGAAALTALLDAQPVDAVFCFNDELALGAMHAAARRSLRVPGDLAIAGFDDIEDGRYATPTLTTIVPDKATIAEQVLACLAERLTRHGRDQPARHITAPHRLEVRESTGSPSA